MASKQQQKNDLNFLIKMKQQSESLLKQYDITKLEYLDKMISDWIEELKAKVDGK